ncbi:MAG: NAD-dependent epimerase/dehydratase family protein, partial [Cyclobacteriaceae bacterium]
SFEKAMKDCELVIHTASPFLIGKTSNADKQFIKPALEGTLNVLNTANKIHSVKRIVLTSSTAATYGDAIDAKDLPNRTLNETHWNTSSNSSHQAYSYSKTIAEKEAWKIAKAQQRWDLVVINPGFVLGPSLSKRIDSASIDFMRQLVKGQMKAGVPDMYLPTVDVRDVALAHILAGTIASASGRHLVVAETMNVAELAKRLKKTQKDSIAVSSKVIPKAIMYIAGPIMGFSFKYVKRNIGIPLNFDNSYSISDLGVEYRPIETTLAEHVEQLRRDQLV